MRRERKAELLVELQDSCDGCEGCDLHKGRDIVVFGEGSVGDGTLLIVGEAPGEEEDNCGYPFVGPAGRLMDELFLFQGHTKRLREIQEAYNDNRLINYEELRQFLVEDEQMFYTNMVLCRPPENRDPSPKEMHACRDRLWRTLRIIDPICVVALGKVALNGLMQSTQHKITKDHGRLYELKVPGEYAELRYPLFALVHPAFIAREGDHGRKDSWANKTEEELEELFELVDTTRNLIYGTPIPERPRRRK